MKQPMDIKQIFIEESARSGWKSRTEPAALFKALGETIEHTRVRAAGLCFGSQLRTDVCNALFRGASAGIETAAAAALGVQVEAPAKEEPLPQAEEKAESAPEVTADFLQPVLLGAGFILCALTLSVSLKRPLSLLSPIAALLLGVALVREVKRMHEAGALAQVVRVLFKKKKTANMVIALLRLEKGKKAAPEKEAPAKASPAHASPAHASPAGEEKAPGRTLGEAQIAAIDALCIRHMELIEQNLPVFQEAPLKEDTDQTLWPLVRTILQKKYADEVAFPDEVEEEMARYFRANGMTVHAYSGEHAALFKTQPMDETFTIFPAIIGKDGRIIEYGQACVKEE